MILQCFKFDKLIIYHQHQQSMYVVHELYIQVQYLESFLFCRHVLYGMVNHLDLSVLLKIKNIQGVLKKPGLRILRLFCNRIFKIETIYNLRTISDSISSILSLQISSRLLFHLIHFTNLRSTSREKAALDPVVSQKAIF